MREAPASVDAMLETTEHTLARCLRLELRDGTVLGFSDHDEDLTINNVVYAAGAGILVGDIETSIGFEADSTEFQVPIDEIATREKVLGRRFNQAEVWIFDADSSEDAPAETPLLYGHVTESRVEGGVAVLEIRSQADLWNVTVGRILSPRCSADFGDDQCGVDKTDIATTIVSVESSLVFTVDLAGDYADQYFRFGECEFTSGPLDGVWILEVLQYEGATARVELFEPLPEPPAVGNALILRRGCSRLKRSDDASVPTCATYDNVLRFRGFDRVPGSDVFVRIPVPGTGSTGGSPARIGTFV